MLEKMFTTKMNADKKKLQSRFSKIRSKNGKLSKVIGGILFGIIIAAIICVGVTECNQEQRLFTFFIFLLEQFVQIKSSFRLCKSSYTY